MNDKTQIRGIVEIRDKDRKLLYENKNTILPFGKYKILSSLFSSKNESVDGIKYLELYLSSDDDLNEIKNYNNLHKIKTFAINRRENIEVLQYDTDTQQWIGMGNVLKKYRYSEKNYREKMLLEKVSNPINDFYTFMNLYNMENQCKNFNEIQIQFNIPIFKKYDETIFSFNLLVLSYGGIDVSNDEFGKVLVDGTTYELTDSNITNQLNYETQSWTSGLPFSYIQLPETFEVSDQLYIYWKYIFNFNEIMS